MAQATYPHARGAPFTPTSELVMPACLFGVAPSGVYLASHVATAAGVSYTSGSPLPVKGNPSIGGVFSVALSVAFSFQGKPITPGR